MKKTLAQYNHVLEKSFCLYQEKFKDYGASWRIMRLSSLTDQIFIKAKRIRSIQEKKKQKVAEGIDSEFIGILNYALMALIQLELKPTLKPDLTEEKACLRLKKSRSVFVALMLFIGKG